MTDLQRKMYNNTRNKFAEQPFCDQNSTMYTLTPFKKLKQKARPVFAQYFNSQCPSFELF